jgi:translation initiation factor IF-3
MPIKDKFRINRQIRKSPVRLIDEEGEQVGVVPIEEARERAEEVGLDLVEVGPNAEPPVVKILDWGKMKYEEEKKAREARKRQQTIEVKEVKYRPSIEDHDYEIKTNRARKFLEQGKKVKFTVFFRYRQLRRPELGEEVLNRAKEDLKDIAAVESRSPMEGRRLVMVMAPLSKEAKKKQRTEQPEKQEAASA